ncbi:hypothetical protein [Streptomyces sp. URMC 129]|uniref:hypothetical protein n=1 Tax=Streptomyces sp. URMC 129 TaxID=3423407 RepID=UPI003F1E265A
MSDEKPLVRDPATYLAFILAPLNHAYETVGRELLVVDSPVHYVVKSDFTAFYQYVDHEILGQELLSLTGKHESIQALLELIQECQGRRFGIPQLFDASDRLSEVYADVVERDMLRQGFPTWRFNDDFRIACVDYANTLDAIEALDRSARSVGLTLGEHKTVTPSFATYALEVMGLTVSDQIPAPERSDPEFAVVDYVEDALHGDPEEAEKVIEKIVVSHEGAEVDGVINLADVSIVEMKEIRRALNGLARSESDAAFGKLRILVGFLPALMPNVSRYLIARNPDRPAAVAEAFSDICEHVSLSDWQRVWMLHVCRVCELLSDSSAGYEQRIQWVIDLLKANRSPTLNAWACLCLAEAERADVAVIDYHFRRAPSALSGWYISALSAMSKVDSSVVERKQFKAMKASFELAKFIF